MTKSEVISNVNKSLSSIYSKDDVLKMLNELSDNNSIDKEKLLDKIRDAVENAVDNLDKDDIIDEDSCSFEIKNNNEVTLENVDIETKKIISNIMIDVESAIDEFVDEN